MALPADGPLAESGAHLKRFLAAYRSGLAPGDRLVAEVRALEVPQGAGGWTNTFAGFFDLADERPVKLWESLKGFLQMGPALQPIRLYLTLNPVLPDLAARANNRLVKLVGKKAISACKKDITLRRWLLIDIDPERPSGVSATEGEKAAAMAVADAVRADLAGRGWPAPMLIDSGNGVHVWYRIDLPADDGGAVEKVLKALAARHDTPAARVDTQCADPVRLGKIPGTWNRKGDSTPDRPHRMVRVLEVPGE